MSGNGIGFDAESLGHDDRVQEYGRLRHFGLFQFFGRAGEHDVRDAETEDFVRFFEQFLCGGHVVVQILAHTDRLGALAPENVCVFHLFLQFFGLRGQRYEFIS